MAFCEKCGTPLNGTAKFCPNCGAQTPLGLASGDNSDDEEIINDDELEYEENDEQEYDDDEEQNNGGEYYDEEEQPKKRGCLKKFLYAFAIMAFIGFLGEKCGNKTDKGDGAQDSIQQATEQVETEAEEVAEADDAVCDTITQDAEEQPSELSSREKEIADAGTKQGAMFGMAGASNDGFSNMLDAADYVDGMSDKVDEIFKEMAGGEYDKQYGAPANSEEEKLKGIYIEHFIKAMNSTMDAMDNMEKLGGKH